MGRVVGDGNVFPTGLHVLAKLSGEQVVGHRLIDGSPTYQRITGGLVVAAAKVRVRPPRRAIPSMKKPLDIVLPLEPAPAIRSGIDEILLRLSVFIDHDVLVAGRPLVRAAVEGENLLTNP